MTNGRNVQTDAGWQVTIVNDSAKLPELQDLLERFGRQHGIPARTVGQLQVVVDELASNVIKYAWPDGGLHRLSISLGLRENAVSLAISDDGAAFNPLDAPPPLPPVAGSRPRPGGVGIHMVLQLVDTIEYARTAGHNRLTITKRLS